MMAFKSKHPCNICATAQYEFLIIGSLCVAVRERATGEWLDDHYAVDERVSLVPCRRDPSGLSRWALQVATFGNTVRIGPLERVEAADERLKDVVLQQLGSRLRLVGPEADEWGPRDEEPFIPASFSAGALH